MITLKTFYTVCLLSALFLSGPGLWPFRMPESTQWVIMNFMGGVVRRCARLTTDGYVVAIRYIWQLLLLLAINVPYLSSIFLVSLWNLWSNFSFPFAGGSTSSVWFYSRSSCVCSSFLCGIKPDSSGRSQVYMPVQLFVFNLSIKVTVILAVIQSFWSLVCYGVSD